MSNVQLMTVLQKELDELSRRRKSLETDVISLEQRINVVDQKLKSGNGTGKMLSLKEFLEVEKRRIQQNKLSRINLQARQIEERIKSIKEGQSQSSSMQSLILSSLSRPHTSSDSKKYCAYCQDNVISRASMPKRKSSVPSIRVEQSDLMSTNHLPLCMSVNVCKDCSDMRDFLMNVRIENERSEDVHQGCTESICSNFNHRKSASPHHSINSRTSKDTQQQTSKTNVDFLMPFSNDFQIKNYCMSCKASINQINEDYSFNENDKQELDKHRFENQENMNKMLKTCESAGVCSDCAKLQGQCIDIISSTDSDKVIGISQKFAVMPQKEKLINSEELDIKSLSPSILATCDSYTMCECCNHNLSKLDMPTPTESIVQMECVSHENCTKCSEILESSRKNSLEGRQSSPKVVSHEILYTKSMESGKFSYNPERAKSYISIKRVPEDLTKYHPRNKLKEEIRNEIEFQSHMIYNTQEELSKLVILHGNDERVIQLRSMLEKENMKLQDMMRLAKIEERRARDYVW